MNIQNQGICRYKWVASESVYYKNKDILELYLTVLHSLELRPILDPDDTSANPKYNTIMTQRVPPGISTIKDRSSILLGFYKPDSASKLDVSFRVGCPSIDAWDIDKRITTTENTLNTFMPILTTPSGKTIPLPIVNMQYMDIQLENHTGEDCWAIYMVFDHRLMKYMVFREWNLPFQSLHVKHGMIIPSQYNVSNKNTVDFITIPTELLKSLHEASHYARENFVVYEKELIEKAWHPRRFLEWCVEEDERALDTYIHTPVRNKWMDAIRTRLGWRWYDDKNRYRIGYHENLEIRQEDIDHLDPRAMTQLQLEPASDLRDAWVLWICLKGTATLDDRTKMQRGAGMLFPTPMILPRIAERSPDFEYLQLPVVWSS